MPWELRAEVEAAALGPQARMRYVLLPGRECNIGRKDCQVMVEDRSISRKHATLTVEALDAAAVVGPPTPPAVHLKEFSRYGTYVGQPSVKVMGDTVAVPPGTVMRFGVHKTLWRVAHHPLVLLVDPAAADRATTVQMAVALGAHVAAAHDAAAGALCTHVLVPATGELVADAEVLTSLITALLSGCPPVTCEWLRVCAARTSPADPWPDAALYAPASLRVLPTDDDSLAAALPPTAPKAWVHHRSTALAGFAFTLDAACTAANPKLPAVLTSAGGKVVAEGATAPDRMRLVSVVTTDAMVDGGADGRLWSTPARILSTLCLGSDTQLLCPTPAAITSPSPRKRGRATAAAKGKAVKSKGKAAKASTPEPEEETERPEDSRTPTPEPSPLRDAVRADVTAASHADKETVPVGVPAATPKHVRPTVPPGYTPSNRSSAGFTPSNRSSAGFTPSSSKKPLVAADGDEPEEAEAKVDDDDNSVVTFSAALVFAPPPKVASKSRKKGLKTPEVNFKTFVKRPVLAGNTARTLVPYASEVVVDADLAQADWLAEERERLAREQAGDELFAMELVKGKRGAKLSAGGRGRGAGTKRAR